MTKRVKPKQAVKKPRVGRPANKTFRHIVLILLTGAVVRLIYDANLTGSIFLGNYILDSMHFHTWATKILAGRTADIAFFRAPLYPYLVALVYKMFGVSPWSVIVLQNLLGLLTSVVSYLFARRLFGPKVALWTALVVVVYPTLVFFEGETLITTLAVFLYTLTAYRMLLAVQESTAKNVIKAGLIFGLAAITRPTILPMAIIFPAAFLAKYGIAAFKEGVVKSLVFVVALFIPILPVTFTNLIKGGEFVLISTQGGANFYIGNFKEADGITVIAPGPHLRIGPYKDNIWTSSMDEAERRAGRKLTQSEVSSFWFREAFKEIRSDVGRVARLYLKKFYLFWHGQEIFNEKPVYYAGEYSRLMWALVWQKFVNFPSGFLIPLMFVGVFLAFRNKREVFVPVLYVLLFALVVSAFFVCARFRQPIIPVAVMLAVYTVVELIRLYRENRKVFFLTGTVLVMLIVGLNWGDNVESKINLSQFQAMLGGAYLNQEDYANAIPHLERSLEILPDNLGVYDMMGRAYLSSGRVKDAEVVYQRGVEIFPIYPQFNFNLGRISQMRENFEKAKEYYHLTLEYAPQFAPALDRLGYIFDQQNQLDSALYYYQRLERLNPPDSRRLKAKIKELHQALSSEK